MTSIAKKSRVRKSSTVGAAGVMPHGTPGDEQGSSRGSNGRNLIYAPNDAQGRPPRGKRWLSIRHRSGFWEVVRYELTTGTIVEKDDRTRPLPLIETHVLVYCDTLKDATVELANWCEGLGLPCADMGSSELIFPSCDPGWR